MIEFLEVLVGLVFVLTLLALATSTIMEIVAALFSMRGAMLWESIDILVGGDLGKKLRRQQLIAGVASRSWIDKLVQRDGRAPSSEISGSKPSYLKPELFAMALERVLLQAARDEGEGEDPETPLPLSSLTGFVFRASSPREQDEDEDADEDEDEGEDQRKIFEALSALLQDVDSFTEARKNIAAWYATAMDRVSGRYKRRVQFVSFVIGLTLSVVLGVDSLAIVDALWTTPSLRASVVTAAESYVEDAAKDASASDSGPALDTSRPADEDAEPPPADADSDSAERATDDAKLEQLQTKLEHFQAIAVKLQSTRLPLYPFAERAPACEQKPERSAGEDCTPWLQAHWLGFLLSGLAASLGAPFWFDLLNQLVNLRATFKPKSESSERAGEGRKG